LGETPKLKKTPKGGLLGVKKGGPWAKNQNPFLFKKNIKPLKPIA